MKAILTILNLVGKATNTDTTLAINNAVFKGWPKQMVSRRIASR